MSTIPWKPLSEKPKRRNILHPPKNGAKFKVFFAGGKYPVGLDYFNDPHPDRTHWCYREDIPGPPKKAATKKAAKKAAKKTSRRR